MPKVSIIIPVHNAEKHLRQCMDSIVNQTLRDIEIVCVDDGSTDGGAAILSEYAAKDARIKVLLHDHTNAGAARNAGMAVATGEYLGFVDSDDWCELTLFEKAYAKARADDADVVAWRFRQYDERVKKTVQERFFSREMLALEMPYSPEAAGASLFTPLAYAPWGRLVRRSFIESERIRFQEIERTNDVYFFCMVSALARRQTILDEILYVYRVGTGTNLQSNNAASPGLVFFAWQLVAHELVRRGVIDTCRKALIAASANSLMYTLNVMSTPQAHGEFFLRLRKLYLEDEFYSTVKIDDIPIPQTATYVEMLKNSETQVEFLVKQENYYRERLATEYWQRVGAQKANSEARRELKECQARVSSLEGERDAAKVEAERIFSENKALKAASDELRNGNAALSSELAALTQKVDGIKRECERVQSEKKKIENSYSFLIGRAVTWLPRKIRASLKKRQ